MRMCFVILHYRTVNDTIDCISSIMKLNEQADIVVVDNASENGSIEKIENIYRNISNIIIIKNERNLGFAKGNNVGYQYARHQLHSDMIAVLNNDIVIETKDFIEKVFKLYERSAFYVAGPDIESLADHHHQNPMSSLETSTNAVIKEIWRYRILIFLSKLNLYDVLKWDKRRIMIKKQMVNNRFHDEIEDVVLHGAFMIFSKNFIEKEEYAFRPETFLYMEESILYKYCLQKQYKMVYSPVIKVFHKEDSSTNSLFNATKNKREFVFKNMVKSLKVYLNIMKKMGEY